VAEVVRNKESSAASGSCAVQISAKNLGHVECESSAMGGSYSATFDVTSLAGETGIR
jgi:hypothetical protein